MQAKVAVTATTRLAGENEELIPYFLLFPAYCFSPTRRVMRINRLARLEDNVKARLQHYIFVTQ